MYEIYTTGGGTYIIDILNGVAALIGSGDYITAMKISGLFALFILMITVAFNGDFKSTVKWLGGFLVLYNVVMIPQVTVNVIDRINPDLAPSIVAHVPYGLAELASLTSQLGDGMTTLAEEAYGLPDDLQYQKYGMIFGSQLLAKTMEIKIVDSRFAANINAFTKQCIFYDLLLNHYSMDDLKVAPDIWKFITETNTQSVLRSFVYTDNSGSQIVTCHDGAITLSGLWANQVSKAADVIAPMIYNGRSQAEAKSLFLTNLPISQDFLMGLSSSSSEILQQTMMINAFHYALADNAASTNSGAAMDIYTNARTDAQTEETYKVIARRAGAQVAKLKVVFEAVYYGSFPLVFLMMLLPGGFAFFRTYAMGLVWLQLWGPMNAILHRVMMGEARDATFGISTMPDATNALTLISHAGIAAVNNDIAVTAGFFASTIPFLALMLTKGADAFGSLATSYLGISHGAASQAAHEATTGNISAGNSNIGNHSFNNTSANKVSTSGYMDSSMVKSMGNSGMMSTSYSAGNSTFDRSGMISNLGDTKLNMAESVSNRLSQEAGHQEQLGKQDSIASSKHLSTALEKTGQLMYTMGQNQASGIDYRNDINSNQSKAIEDFNSHTTKFAQQENISTALATKILAGVSAGASWAGFKASLEGSGEVAARSSFDHAQDYAKLHGIKDVLSVGTSLAENKNLNISDSHGHSLTDGINTNLRDAKSLDENSNMHHSKSQSFNESASKVKENSSSINRDQGQKYMEWLENQHYPGSASPYPMGRSGAKEILSSTSPTKIAVNEAMQQKFMDEQSGAIVKQYYPNNTNDMEREFANKSGEIGRSKQEAINASFSDRKIQIQDINKSISSPPVNNNNLKNEVPAKIDARNHRIDNDKDGGHALEEKIHNKLNDNYLQKLKKLSLHPDDAEK